jgi:hypothetical protein
MKYFKKEKVDVFLKIVTNIIDKKLKPVSELRAMLDAPPTGM